ncbi:MAG TPA: energy transducer TonB [Longimicrobium sp.]|nr:energy transducer TonB [Longimicrobium sp.]
MLLASTALLAAAPPAHGQDSWLEPPRLNEGELASQIAAAYPPAQRESRQEGQVLLRIKVLEDGTVDPASVTVQPGSSPAFVEAATALVPRMHFAPARMHGRAVAAWITYPVDFSLPAAAAPGVMRDEPAGPGTYELTTVEEAPVLRNPAAVARQIQARFPRALRERGASGAVLVRFRVLENGTVDPQSPEVEMTTHPGFDEAAVSVVRVARFQPAKVNGWPVRVWVTLPLQFGAEGAPPAADSTTAASARTPPA